MRIPYKYDKSIKHCQFILNLYSIGIEISLEIMFGKIIWTIMFIVLLLTFNENFMRLEKIRDFKKIDQKNGKHSLLEKSIRDMEEKNARKQTIGQLKG